jgi:N-acetylmuramoyl-L-alanine amidase
MGMFVLAITTLLQGSASPPPDRLAAASSAGSVPVTAAQEPASIPDTSPSRSAERASAARAPETPRPVEVEARSSGGPDPAWRGSDLRDDAGDRARRSRATGGAPEDWRPPEGPVRIALQAGHWRADEAPRELSGLRGAGTSWRSTHEWEANLDIARRAGSLLEEMGYEVDILPAVVPPGYRAHLFISIHADGSDDPNASGYRVAAPRRDATGHAAHVARLLEASYGEATGLRRIPTATRRMRNYYAFNYRRYEHALHPMTIGVILETGFMTSARDRAVILSDPDRAARGIVAAIASFPETLPPVAAGTR